MGSILPRRRLTARSFSGGCIFCAEEAAAARDLAIGIEQAAGRFRDAIGVLPAPREAEVRGPEARAPEPRGPRAGGGTDKRGQDDVVAEIKKTNQLLRELLRRPGGVEIDSAALA